MTYKVFPLLLLVVMVLPVFSQQLQGVEAQTNLQMLGGAAYTARTFDNRYAGVKGSPALFNEPLPCIIVTTDNRKVNSPRANFDAYTNELVVIRGNQELIMGASAVKRFSFLSGADSVHFVKVSLKEGTTSYLQQLEKGNCSLLKLHKKIFRQADYKGAYSQGRTQDEFIDDQEYYLLVNNLVIEVKNKKGLLKAIPEKADQIESLVKSNKLDLKNENDLRALIAELNRT